jgi:hypothetical protein
MFLICVSATHVASPAIDCTGCSLDECASKYQMPVLSYRLRSWQLARTEIIDKVQRTQPTFGTPDHYINLLPIGSAANSVGESHILSRLRGEVDASTAAWTHAYHLK